MSSQVPSGFGGPCSWLCFLSRTLRQWPWGWGANHLISTPLKPLQLLVARGSFSNLPHSCPECKLAPCMDSKFGFPVSPDMNSSVTFSDTPLIFSCLTCKTRARAGLNDGICWGQQLQGSSWHQISWPSDQEKPTLKLTPRVRSLSLDSGSEALTLA